MIDTVFFDIEKVLVQIDYTRISHTLAFHSSLKSHVINYKLLEGEALHLFRTGAISSKQFFDRLKSDLCLTESLTEEIFHLIYLGGFKYDELTYTVLYKLNRKRVQVGLLANIDPLMWGAFKNNPIIKNFFSNEFQHQLSYMVGTTKPDTDMFCFACDSFHIEPSQALLVDSDTLTLSAFKTFGGHTIEHNAEHEYPQALHKKLASLGLMQ